MKNIILFNSTTIIKPKLAQKTVRREAWSSGWGKRLMSKGSWVPILPYTGWM
jgi:hypothetical protein